MWKQLAALIAVGFIVLLSGCWDTLDVERNGFVLGVGIDLAEDEDKNTFRMTNQVAIPTKRSTRMQGGAEGKPYVNMTVKGDSMLAMVRETAQQSSRVPSFEHMKVLIISSEVAKKQDLFTSVLDLFIRDMEMRRSIKVMISDRDNDKAKSILEVEPSIEQLPSLYIDDVSKNTDLTLRMSPSALIGDVEANELQEFSYILPRVYKPAKGYLKDNGAAVFRGAQNQMVGTLTPEEVLGMNLIKQRNKNSVFKFEVENHQMTYELDYGDPQIDIDPEDPKQMDVTITINTQGRISEMFGGKSLMQKSYVKQIQNKITDKMEHVAEHTIDKLQNELKTDVLGISQQLSQKYPYVWDEVSDNWEKGEQYFSNADIHVKATAEVHDIGASDKTKQKRKDE